MAAELAKVWTVWGQILVPWLRINTTLQTALEKAHLPQKFWYQSFGDYILAKLWEDLTGERGNDDGETKS